MKECTVKKPLPLLIGFGMGCCRTCLPLHPCSISFICAHPRPRSYALYAPAFALVYVPAFTPVCTCLHTCLRSHSFVHACICAHSHPFVRACVRAQSQVPALVPVRTCLDSPAPTPTLFVCASCCPRSSVPPSFVHDVCACVLPLTGLCLPCA
jgi:hypothetical protein